MTCRRHVTAPGWRSPACRQLVSFAALAENEPLRVRRCSPRPGATFPFGAHVAVVEVDTETGQGDAARG